VTTEINGFNGDTALMGPQTPKTLMALLQECESADMGLIYETRDTFGLGYRTRVTLTDQNPELALDYSNAQLVPPFAPTDDDQLLANDVTVTRQGGSSYNAMLQTGPVSVNDPPAGVGDYPKTYTLNLFTDEQLAGAAGWLLGIGSVDQQRFPSVNIDMARNASIGGVFTAIAQLGPGDLLTIAHPPAGMPPELIQQLVVGWTEVLNTYQWTIQWNCVPALPYFTAILGNGAYYGKIDTDGSQLNANITTTATSMQVAPTGTGYPLWTTAAADFPFDIIMNGERITVTNITSTTSPQVFTVTRSVNGVVLAHTAGETLSLFYQPRLGI
jgi:hypothetical protein